MPAIDLLATAELSFNGKPPANVKEAAETVFRCGLDPTDPEVVDPEAGVWNVYLTPVQRHHLYEDGYLVRHFSPGTWVRIEL